VGGDAAVGGVHDARGRPDLLGVLLVPGGLFDRVVADRQQPPVRVGAEPDPLPRRGAVGGAGEGVLAGQRELDRVALRRVGRQQRGDVVRPRHDLRPEPAAHVRRVHHDLIPLEAEQRGQHVLRDRRALVGVVHGHTVVRVPDGDRGAGLHRVVEVPRRGELAVHPHRRRRPRRLEVTVGRVRVGRAADDDVRAVLVRVVGPEERVPRYGVKLHCDQCRRQTGQFRGFRHGQRDELAPEVHRVVLQHPQFAVGVLGQPAGVLVRDDPHAVVQRERLGGVDAGDAAGGHGGPHRM
jgi:hypothetical protein